MNSSKFYFNDVLKESTSSIEDFYELNKNTNNIFEDIVRKHQIESNNLTESQLAEALKQSIKDFERYVYVDGQQVVYIPFKESEKWKTLYHELIYAVSEKFEGETRHETALRYIINAEKGINQNEKIDT